MVNPDSGELDLSMIPQKGTSISKLHNTLLFIKTMFNDSKSLSVTDSYNAEAGEE